LFFAGEAGSVDLNVVQQGQLDYQAMLASLNPDLIYNMDELGLFWKLLPDYTLMLSSGERGTKRSKARVTVVLTINMSGTDKRPAVLIGKASQPQCWSKSEMKSLPVVYKHSNNAWMTGYLFEDYLIELNSAMRLLKKHIMLIVDGAGIILLLFSFLLILSLLLYILSGPHVLSEEIEKLCSYVRVTWLPPNCTAMIQPLDQGIIRALKALYRHLLLRHIIRYYEKYHVCQLFVIMHVLAVRFFPSWSAISAFSLFLISL